MPEAIRPGRVVTSPDRAARRMPESAQLPERAPPDDSNLVPLREAIQRVTVSLNYLDWRQTTTMTDPPASSSVLRKKPLPCLGTGCSELRALRRFQRLVGGSSYRGPPTRSLASEPS